MGFIYEQYRIASGKICLLVEWNRIKEAEVLASEIRSLVLDSDFILLRCDKNRSIGDLKKIKKYSKPFRERFSHKEIYLIYSKNFSIKITSIGADGWLSRKENIAPFIEEFRQLELLKTLETKKAIFPKTPPGTFVKSPSGAIVNTFIRTGNVQTSIETLDVFFFWLIPELKDVDSLILDTWTISSIGLNISRRLSLYKAKKNDYRKPIYVDVLSHYYGKDPNSKQELEKIVRGLKSYGLKRPLFVFSASATGASLDKLISDVKFDGGYKYSKFISLYSFTSPANSELNSLCVLDSYLIDVQYGREEESPQVFVIDAETYMPNILDVANEESSIRIGKQLLEKSSKFFTTYAGCSSFSVHKSLPENQGRHHAFYVCMERLVLHPVFKSKLQEIVKTELVEKEKVPLLIITPETQSSRAMADLAVQCFKALTGITPSIHSIDRVADDQTLTSALRSADKDTQILILEDVCVTGWTIANYQGQLRDLNFKGVADILVGVMRPESEQILNDVKCYRTWAHGKQDPNRLHFVEYVLLPNWNESECPWKQEERDLMNWVGVVGLASLDSELKKFIENRLVALRRVGATFDDCFTSQIQVTDGSFWIEGGQNLSQGDILCAVASGLQYFRAEGISGSKLGGSYPNRVILNDMDLFGDNWQNAVLQLGIWRTAKTGELQSVDHKLQQERILKLNNFLAKPDTSPTAGDEVIRTKCYEVAIAIMAKKIPYPLSAIHIPKIVEDSVEAEFLRQIISTFSR